MSDGGVAGSRASSRRRRTEPAPTAVPTQRVVRMRDIAAASGVSQSTVSRVLSGGESRVPIAAETRERILEAARSLGYRPNPLARGLRGASTNLIGAVVRDFSDPFFAEAIEALVVESMSHGYNVVLGHVQRGSQERVPLTSVLETRHTDAIVLVGDLCVQPQLLADLRDSPVPVVALWPGTSPLTFPSADTDDRAGIEAGLEHLAELGHRRIAFISAELPGDFWVREAAYIDFMRERFGSVPAGYVERSPNTMAGGDAALRRLLARPKPPTAIATSTDLIAVGALHAAHSLGATVPDKLSVVGFDDISISSHTVPALTTSRMPIPKIISYAIDLAVTMAREPGTRREPSLQVFTPELVVRESTAPVPRGRTQSG